MRCDTCGELFFCRPGSTCGKCSDKAVKREFPVQMIECDKRFVITVEVEIAAMDIVNAFERVEALLTPHLEEFNMILGRRK